MPVHDARGVLFDLDGTLLDTAPDLAGAVNDIRRSKGLESLPLEQLAPMCSFGARGMLSKGLDLTPQDSDYQAHYDLFIETYRARLTQETRPFDGMRDLVESLDRAGWRWGVVTNKTEALARPLMAHMEFDPPPACIIGGDSARAPKPDPAPLRLACAQTGLSPEQCIYVGDSDRDVSAGRAAGMKTVGVSFGYIPPGDDARRWAADRVVDRVSDLFEAITELANTD